MVDPIRRLLHTVWPLNVRAAGWIEVRFASFLFGGFTTTAVMNPPERKLKKCTSVRWAPGFLIKVFS